MRKTFVDVEVRVWIEFEESMDTDVAINYIMVNGCSCYEEAVKVIDTQLLTKKTSVVNF